MGRFVELARSLVTGGFLSGYRTYIIGLAVAFQAFASWAVLGEQSLFDFLDQLPEILGGAGLMTARAAIDKLLAEIRQLRAMLLAIAAPPIEAPFKPEGGWSPADSGAKLRSIALPLGLAFGAALLLSACADSPEGRWAQAQTAYNEGVETAVRYRKPCVDFGRDHPLCKIDDDLYRIIEPIRERLDSLLKRADAAIQAGNDVGFEIYMTEVDKLLETFLLYTTERGATTSELLKLRDLKHDLLAFHQTAKESAHHENRDSRRRAAGPGGDQVRPLHPRADLDGRDRKAAAGSPSAAIGRAGPGQPGVGSTRA